MDIDNLHSLLLGLIFGWVISLPFQIRTQFHKINQRLDAIEAKCVELTNVPTDQVPITPTEEVSDGD